MVYGDAHEAGEEMEEHTKKPRDGNGRGIGYFRVVPGPI